MLNWRLFLAIGIAHLGLAQTCCLADELQNSKSAYAQGKVYEQSGDYHFAILNFRHALELDPTNLEIKADLVAAYAKMEYKTPNDPLLHIGHGQALEMIGDKPGAIEEYEAAIRLSPGKNNTEASRLLAKLTSELTGTLNKAKKSTETNEVTGHDEFFNNLEAREGKILGGKTSSTDSTTKTPEFVEYMKQLQDTITENWRPSNVVGHKKVKLKFSITSDGHQSAALIAKSSDATNFDQSAVDAVHASDFKPLPKSAPKTVALEVTFDCDGTVISDTTDIKKKHKHEDAQQSAVNNKFVDAQVVAPDVDFGPYMADLQRRIKRAWFPPKGNESKRVVVQFKVHTDGSLTNLRIDQSSGVPDCDRAALKAVANADLRPLPENAPENVDTQFTFDYNVFGGGGKHGTFNVFTPPLGVKESTPSREPLTVDSTPNFDFEAAKNRAQNLERYGKYAEANSVYDKIASENNSAIERVKLFEALGKAKDKNAYLSAMLACLRAVSKATTVPIDVRASLIEQLTENIYSKKMSATQISDQVSSSSEVSLAVKYPFAVSLLASAIKHGDTTQHIAQLKTALDHDKNRLEGFKQFEDIGRGGWELELRGEFAQALSAYRKQLEMRQETLGKDDPEILALSGDIARVLAEQGHFAQSEKLFEETRAAFKKTGFTDYRYVRLLECYGDVLNRDNKKQLASEIYKEAVSAYRATNIADEQKNKVMILKIQ